MPRPRIDHTLRFCVTQAGDLAEHRDALRWLVVGLALALQEACVLALSGYDTADPGDILTPGQTELATIETLLRRVSSERYLAAPEKLGVGKAKVDGALALYRARNQIIHARPTDPPPDRAGLNGPVQATLLVIKWLVVDFPAFEDPTLTAQCRDALRALTDLLETDSAQGLGPEAG